MPQESELEDGIHFGLDESVYHALSMISAHDIKQLLISGPDYWEGSHMNPEPDEEADDDTFHRILGRAYHTRILEGQDAFASRFADKFECPEDALDTNDELKEELRKRELAVGGNKQVLIDRLLADDPTTKIKAVLEAEYIKKHEGKDFLEHKCIRRIQRAASMIECHKDIRKCFMGGFPEVTIIWTADDIRRRARLDYLKPAALSDLKSFANKFGKPVSEAIISSFAYAKHHIQAEYYTDAARAAVGFAKDGKITVHSGDAPTKEWISLLASQQGDHKFFFVFQKTDGAPVARHLTFECPGMRGAARRQIEEAVATYKQCLEFFGDDGTPWVDMTGLEDFSDEDFPPWAA
jgi:SAP domain